MDTKITRKRFSENQRNDKSIEKKTKFDKEPRNAVLPDEIWLKIMCHLNSKDLLITFGLVCKLKSTQGHGEEFEIEKHQ